MIDISKNIKGMYGGVLDDMNFDNLNMIMNVKSDATMEERYESVIELIEVHMEKKGFNPETYWSELVKPDEVPNELRDAKRWGLMPHIDLNNITRQELSNLNTKTLEDLTMFSVKPEDYIINDMVKEENVIKESE